MWLNMLVGIPCLFVVEIGVILHVRMVMLAWSSVKDIYNEWYETLCNDEMDCISVLKEMM